MVVGFSRKIIALLGRNVKINRSLVVCNNSDCNSSDVLPERFALKQANSLIICINSLKKINYQHKSTPYNLDAIILK